VGWQGTWTLTLIVLAVIGIAVGDELAIAHPGDDATLGFTILAFGGPALFLRGGEAPRGDLPCHLRAPPTRLSDGRLLVEGKTWTGFADSEEDYADEFVGQRIQPFRIEEEAKKLEGTNFIVSSRFKSHTVRDGLLITGQQQYSGAAAARLIVQALGV
jgi:putative intracellular protease/amidase